MIREEGTGNREQGTGNRMKSIKQFFNKISGRTASRPACSQFPVPSSLFPVPFSLSGFTLIELLVVIAMLSILIGSVGSGIAQSRRRAQIAKATQDAKEITNAILGFRNYAKDRSLVNYATGGWKETDEGSLKMILGGETSESGDRVPVLYNAHLRSGKIVDPWGTTYKFQIRKITGESEVSSVSRFARAPNLPNFHRLTDEERQ